MTSIAIRGQRGATLLVTLVMLVVLTLFAVTGFNLSSVNLKIVGNFQQQKDAEATVQDALERALSSIDIFSASPLVAKCLPSGDAPVGTAPNQSCTLPADVLITKPKCNYSTAATGYTKKLGELTPEDTNWELRASYTDPLTKAAAAVVQGVAVRMLAGNCPAS